MRFSLLIFGLSLFYVSNAQRVIRKGTTPKNDVRTDTAKALYHTADFQGRWQEVERKDNKGVKQHFTDTLLLWFNGKKVESRDATSMRITMSYEYEILPPNGLAIGTDEFQVVQLNKKVMVLQNEENRVSTFLHKQKFYYETVGKDSALKEPKLTPVEIDPSVLKGRWEVYRIYAPPGATNNRTMLVRSIELLPMNDSSGIKGNVSIQYQGELQTHLADIVFHDQLMTIRFDDVDLNYATFKADEKEFVFGDNNKMVFYCRKVAD